MPPAALTWRFDPPLVPATLVRRDNRFIASARLEDGRTVLAHCTNTGSLMGVVRPGARIYLRPEPPRRSGPPRRTRFTWVLVRHRRHWVGIDTLLPNRLVAQAVRAGALPGLEGYAAVRTEVPYGTGSRVDLLLEAPRDPEAVRGRTAGDHSARGRPARGHNGRGHSHRHREDRGEDHRHREDRGEDHRHRDHRNAYVEIKNCHLTAGTLDPGIPGPRVPYRRGRAHYRDIALFPDAPTERGRKHLEELARVVAGGHRGVLLVVVQRNDCDAFAAAAGIDPDYARLLCHVAEAGVEVHAWACAVSPQAVRLARPLPVLLSP